MNNQPATSQYDLDAEFAFIFAKDPKKAYKEKDSADEEDEEIINNEDDDACELAKLANAHQSEQQENQDQENKMYGV